MMGAERLAIVFTLAAAGCISASAHQSSATKTGWDDWFGEYAEEVGDGKLITIFENRFVETNRVVTIDDRERSDTADYFHILKNGNAYYVDRIPVFLPSETKKSIEGPVFNCISQGFNGEYDVTCETKDKKWQFKSFVTMQNGVTWFEYFCRWPPKLCRYNFKAGARLLNSKQRAATASST